VINLGIKVPPNDLIEAVKKHHPDFIGLSGLLVKSAQQMVTTAEDLRVAGVTLPILVGGAALSEQFTYGRIATKYDGIVAYASDAMTGLDLANRVVGEATQDEFRKFIDDKKLKAREREEKKAQAAADGPVREQRERIIIDHSQPAPTPPDTKLHVIDNVPLETIWAYINPVMLYNRHLGLKGKYEDLLAAEDEKAMSLTKVIRDLQNEVLDRQLLRARSVCQFFRAASDGDSLLILDHRGSDLLRFDFPRQPANEQRCLSDLVPPLADNKRDHVAMFVTSCQGTSRSVRDLAEAWKNSGDYLKSHAFQALAIETAEAMAEWLHQKLRSMWGIPDPPTIAMKDLYRADYRGKRYSFGYPACPRLEDQAKLWQLLDPEKNIGVELTEGFMMDPESSVSALVFQHPQAVYFSVGDIDVSGKENGI